MATIGIGVHDRPRTRSKIRNDDDRGTQNIIVVGL